MYFLGSLKSMNDSGLVGLSNLSFWPVVLLVALRVGRDLDEPSRHIVVLVVSGGPWRLRHLGWLSFVFRIDRLFLSLSKNPGNFLLGF